MSKRQKSKQFEVTTHYAFTGSFELDTVAHDAAGRLQDFSGAGFGDRDLGWVCDSKAEAEKIKLALEKVGLPAEID